MIDIDHFKQVNDTFGHSMGDTVLTKVAEIIKHNCRDEDIAARWGGEEFIILLQHATREECLLVVERLRVKVESEFFISQGKRLSVTISAGIGHLNQDLMQAIEQSDKALYQAKQGGRNRTVVDEIA